MQQTSGGSVTPPAAAPDIRIPDHARTGPDKLLHFAAAMRLLPNRLTAVRFIAVPVMWVFAMLERPFLVGVGLVICLLSDLLDGAAARHLNQCTDFGSKFDSLADQCLQLSAVIWVALLMPEIVTENLLLTITALGLYAASLLVGLIKFQRLANLHLYSSKAAAFFLFLSLIHAFLTGHYHAVLLILAGGLFILSSAETLTLQLISPEVGAGSGSLLFRYLDETHALRRWLSRLP